MSVSLQKNEVSQGIGKRLAAHRARLGMSLHSAAEIIGCSHQGLRNWERGDEPRPIYLSGISRFLSSPAPKPTTAGKG